MGAYDRRRAALTVSQVRDTVQLVHLMLHCIHYRAAVKTRDWRGARNRANTSVRLEGKEFGEKQRWYLMAPSFRDVDRKRGRISRAGVSQTDSPIQGGRGGTRTSPFNGGTKHPSKIASVSQRQFVVFLVYAVPQEALENFITPPPFRSG